MLNWHPIGTGRVSVVECAGHPVLAWNTANAVVQIDPSGARKIAKDRSIERVDGLVALAMAIGEVLSEQAIGVLIGPTLPRAARIAEVNIDVGRQCKPLVVGKLFAAIPGQRFIQFTRQLLRLFDQGRYDTECILVGNLDQHDIARMTFNEGRYMAVP